MGELILPPGVLEKPSDEKYSSLVAELQQAKTQLAAYEILESLEKTEPEGLGQNLLEFRYPRAKNQHVPRGHKLKVTLQGQREVVRVLEVELKTWNAAETAYHENQPKADA